MSNRTAETGAYSWYFLGLLTFIYIVGSIDRNVISVIAEPLKSSFHLKDKQIGLLGGMGYAAAYAIAVLPSGWLIDRRNRRNLLSITVVIWGFLTAFCAFASSYATLMIARLAVGAAEAPCTPASLSLIADIFPKDRRSTAVSFYYAGTSLGQIILFLIGGWLLKNFEWRSVFLVAGIPGVVLATMLFFTTREPRRGIFDAEPGQSGIAKKESIRDGAIRIARTVWRNRPLLLSFPAVTLTSGVTYAVTVWSTSFFVRIYHMSVSQGLIWTGIGFGVCMAVGSTLVGPIADRFAGGNLRKLAVIPMLASIVAIIGGTVMVLGSSLGVAVAGLAIFSLMCGVFYPISYAIALDLAPADQRGAIMAAIRLATMVFGSGLLPFVTGFLSDTIGGDGSIRLALWITIDLLIICTACYAWMYRMLEAQEN